ncbi:MAG: TMEM165/GDT1 family protein [Tissierellaceae bacterium]
MFSELFKAFFLIFVAEMGDKTQIIAMTFAGLFKVKEVILGVVFGVALNHGIAIVLGSFLPAIMPMYLIQVLAGAMFVFFGIISLRERSTEELDSKGMVNPVFIVAMAFFIGELGDKTQLTAMSLSAVSDYPLIILAGTTSGMVATSAMGIVIGRLVGDKIPDVSVRIISSIVFIFFGTLKLLTYLPNNYINIFSILAYLVSLFVIEVYLIDKLLDKQRISESALKRAANLLYEQTKELERILDDLCLGEDSCGKCIGDSCLIGYARNILRNARDNENYTIEDIENMDLLIKKVYNVNMAIQALGMVVANSIQNGWDKDEHFVVNQVRVSLEIVVFGKQLNFSRGLDDYIFDAKKENRKHGNLLEEIVLGYGIK